MEAETTRTKPRQSRGYLFRPTYLIVIFVGLSLAIWLVTIDAFERLFAFSRTHEAFELDEVIPVLLVAGLVAMVILALRERDLRREVRQRELAEHTAERLERYDEITGLPNRRLLFEELHRRIVGSRMHGSRFSLFFLDIDRFTSVNDTFGHASGDEFLRAIGERLVLTLRPHDFVARLGGDEYAIVINGSAEKNVDQHVAQRVLKGALSCS